MVSALYLGGYGFVAARSGFRPLAASSLGSDLLVDYPASIIHRLQIRYVLAKADLVITDADELSRIAASIGAAPEKILKAYLGIDERVFFHSRDAAGAHPEAGGRIRIVSTRNLHPVYRVDVLVEAAPSIRNKSDALFVICGDGPARRRLEERVRELGLTRHFVFRGRLAPGEIAEELRAADIYVSTSRSDSTSVSLLEAMACGALPVVTDLAANREWISDGDNGLIIPVGNPSALANAVLKAARAPQLGKAARDKNARIITERGRWGDNMRRVERAFEQLVERHGRMET
jgi:glycosyltransferase involved in cell wall biosynthesis